MRNNKEYISFYEISFSYFSDEIKDKLKKELLSQDEDYILNVDEEDYIDYLNDKYSIAPLFILKETENISKPEKFRENLSQYGDNMSTKWDRYRDGLRFLISYSFTGEPNLFKVQPNPFTLIANKIYVDEYNHIVSFYVNIFEQDVEKFNREKEDSYSRAFQNIENLNENVCEYNLNIREYVVQQFLLIKSKLHQQNDFFASINVNGYTQTTKTYTVPVIKKRIQRMPKPKTGTIEVAEPTISEKTYNDIIIELNRYGRSVERKPNLYRGKGEEALRDLFVANLEGRFESSTATSETFNHKGKTDIILKDATDGSNLFIAECKIWHGEKHCLDAINQLFDRYLTWRDSKVALILFVQGNNFTNALETIKGIVPNHKYYKQSIDSHGESSFSYIFRLPQDEQKNVFLEVMVFNFSIE